MLNVFQRIFKVAQSGAHSVVDKLEDPIQMTEQGIRDLKRDLQAAVESLAQVKASAIRLKKDAEEQMKRAAEYERKAMLVLQKAQQGGLDPSEAERLATEALQRKEEASQRGTTLAGEHGQQQKMADQLQSTVEKLKQTVRRHENELVTLKARARTATSMRKINEQMAKVDSSGTIAMLERMKTKVMEEETLAEAYGEIGSVGAGLDEQLDKALAGTPGMSASVALDDLKKKMGLLTAS